MPTRRLIYFDTEDEMQLGDRILIRRRLRPNIQATVMHIPGKSPAVAGITEHQFGYETEDGKYRVTDFSWLPGLSWSLVPKEIQLVFRGGEDVDTPMNSREPKD